MLEKLGYTKDYSQLPNILKFYKNDENVICFNKENRTWNKTGEYDGMCDYVTLEEHKAITNMLIKWGWL